MYPQLIRKLLDPHARRMPHKEAERVLTVLPVVMETVRVIARRRILVLVAENSVPDLLVLGAVPRSQSRSLLALYFTLLESFYILSSAS